MARQSIDGKDSSRRVLLESAVIEDRDDAAILVVAGESLLVLSTLDDLLQTLDLAREDLIEE